MRSGGVGAAHRTAAALALWAPITLGAFAALGCSKTNDEGKPIHTFELNVKPGPQPVSPQNADVDAAPVVAAYPRRNPFDDPPSETATATPPPSRPAASAAPAASAKTNPDDAVLTQARVACGRCFASLQAVAGAGDRSAHVSFTVVSTGTVSHADVSSEDTEEASVLDCLQQTAQATRFSDNANGPLRTYAIDVRVHASPVNGGR